MPHFPPWLAYPLVPLVLVSAVALPFVRRHKIAWLVCLAVSGVILYCIDFEKLGPQMGPLLRMAFYLSGTIGLTAMVIRDMTVIGDMFSMKPEDWQREFDEATRKMKKKAAESKDS